MVSWRTPLRSPARLVVTCGAVLGIGFVAAHAVGGVTPPPAPVHTAAAARAPARPAVRTAPDPPGRAALPPRRFRPARAPAGQIRLAAEFTETYLSHIRPQAWRRALARLTTPRLARELAAADPTRVTATRIVGPPRPTVCTRDGCEIAVPTDSGPLVVRTATAGRRATVAYFEAG